MAERTARDRRQPVLRRLHAHAAPGVQSGGGIRQCAAGLVQPGRSAARVQFVRRRQCVHRSALQVHPDPRALKRRQLKRPGGADPADRGPPASAAGPYARHSDREFSAGSAHHGRHHPRPGSEPVRRAAGDLPDPRHAVRLAARRCDRTDPQPAADHSVFWCAGADRYYAQPGHQPGRDHRSRHCG